VLRERDDGIAHAIFRELDCEKVVAQHVYNLELVRVGLMLRSALRCGPRRTLNTCAFGRECAAPERSN
jgi:hypothetical protein